ncbi:TonB-dependent receptor [Caulobacter mirabilis]|nr:TonB-dependent receptor [Caulobacter mirabilis]
MNRAAWIGMAAMSVGGLATPALAEEPTDIDALVVTAARRDQALIDAPVAATVLGAQFAEDARIQSLRRIDDYAPNVQFNQIGQVGGTYISIRGIESNPFVVNRAAVYIDGVPFRQPSDQALGDVRQIEVLRGPQGTLYGANSESGLILVQTRAPSDAFEAQASAGAYGFGEGQGYDLRARVAGPLAGATLTGALTLDYEKADSFVRNLASSIGEPGEIETAFAHGRLRWIAGDRTELDAMGYVALQRAPGLYEQEFLPMDRARYDQLYGGFNGGRKAGDHTLIHDAPKRSDKDEHVLGVGLTHRFDGATLSLAGSWRDVDDRSFGTDLDLTAMPGAAGGHDVEETHWNWEVRLVAPSDARVQWVVGLNHYRGEQSKALSSLIGPGKLSDYAWAPKQEAGSRDYALFGQAVLPLSPTINLTAGVRYERAERDKVQQAGVLDLGPLGRFVFQAEALDEVFAEVLPRVSLDWALSGDLRLYASVAKGWVPGGFNLAASATSVVGDYSRYDAETLWTYEIGAKHRLLGGRALVSAALFYTTVDNWQEINVIYGPNGQPLSTTLVTSSAAITSRGFEIEFAGKPRDDLDLTASLGWVEAEYDRYVFGLEDLSGRRVKLTPEWDASATASWRPWRGLFLRGEINGAGETMLNAQNTARQEAVWRLNAQIGWETEAWTARLYVDNLTDETVFVTSAYANSLFGYDGLWYAGVDAPRVVGVELTRRW